MSRSQKFKIIALLLGGAALALGVTMFLVSLIIGAAMPMNGPWLVAVLASVIGLAFAVAALIAERREAADDAP